MVSRKNRFTLQELLIAVAILSVILALLLPAMARYRENARRTLCSANLKQWGLAASLYADNHAGSFPAAYQSLEAQPKAFPNRLNARQADVASGVTAETFFDYGLPFPSLFCPGDEKAAFAITPGTRDWGPYLTSGYAYIGHLERSTGSFHPHSGRSGGKPMNTIHDSDPANRIMASDTLYRAFLVPGSAAIINHANIFGGVAAQHRLHGDMRVSRLGTREYGFALDENQKNASFSVYRNSGFFFWEGRN